MKKKILIICNGNFNNEPRPNCQIEALKDDYEITLAGFGPSLRHSLSFIQIQSQLPFSYTRKFIRFILLLFRRYDAFYWDHSRRIFYDKIKDQKYDLIIAHDVYTLPLAIAVANGTSKVMMDAHEYHLEEFDDSWKWRILFKPYNYFLCKKYMPKVDLCTIVCSSIAEKYKNEFPLKEVVVITNAAAYHELSPSKISTPIRIIYHGAAIPSRKIENILEVAKGLDERFLLDIMLVPNDENYYSELAALANNLKNVRMIPPVKMGDIVKFTNQYDIGLFLLQPVNFNYKYALPNKLFEFIQARLCIAIGPSPEMERIVSSYSLGIVTENFNPKAMIDKLNSLTTAEIKLYKENCEKNAFALSSSKNKQEIKEAINNLFKS